MQTLESAVCTCSLCRREVINDDDVTHMRFPVSRRLCLDRRVQTEEAGGGGSKDAADY
jgi:hypothetical protein